MIVITMAITASVNASSLPFVTARASHTSPVTKAGYDQDNLKPLNSTEGPLGDGVRVVFDFAVASFVGWSPERLSELRHAARTHSSLVA
jgi:hypothetical protein